MEKKDSMLKKTLDNYRKANRFWLDVLLTLIIITLAGLIVNVLHKKGYMNLRIKKKDKVKVE